MDLLIGVLVVVGGITAAVGWDGERKSWGLILLGSGMFLGGIALAVLYTVALVQFVMEGGRL